MRTFNRQFVRQQGFSLIEVMIAVVVLSTGLLALAALQANLTRSAADSKARSRVAALVSSRMDQMRAQGYASAASVGALACVGTNEVCAAQTDAAISGLTITQTVTENVLAGATDARYKVVRVAAAWTDASGNARTLTMDSVLSPTALDASDTLVDKELSGDSGKAPIVRTANPAVPGMIPIAVSATDSTAATNPRPELLSQGNNSSVIGTKFDVLTYTNESSNTARIQRRVETTVIGCTCQYGAGGNSLPLIYRQAQWPAVWTGARYELYKPDNASTQPPGTALAALAAGPASGVSQSALCTECCRDHHDTASPGVAKFDPERGAVTGETLAHTHYNRDNQGNLVIVPAAANGTYREACRMIRVDGLWRTAADLYTRYAGLLATTSAAGSPDPATSGIPTTAAADAYGGNRGAGINGFVKDFLSANLTGLRSSNWTVDLAAASTLYDNAGLNAPAELAIRRPTNQATDERYHHLRGLYVDYLNQAARDRIATALLPSNCPSGNNIECALPYIPFTTINLTELSFWKAQALQGSAFQDNASVLRVETASALTFNAAQPYRGRTNALTNANNTDTAYAIARVTPSNSGVAVLPRGVDPLDDSIWTLDDPATVPANLRATDRQQFRVTATGNTGGSSRFWVGLTGLPQTSDEDTSNDPQVNWAASAAQGFCGGSLDVAAGDYNPNDYACLNVPALNVPGAVTALRYYILGSESVSVTATCKSGNDDVTVTEVIPRQYYRNFNVTAASVGGVPATSISVATGTEGTIREATQINFALIPPDGVVSLTFTEGASIPARIGSCTAQKNGNNPYTFRKIDWIYPWE